ncbi:MAG TPA: hypothetical protein VIX73_24425 [Kofleriaceae bacterium]
MLNLKAALLRLHEAEDQVPLFTQDNLEGWRARMDKQRQLLGHVDACITAAILAIGGQL